MACTPLTELREGMFQAYGRLTPSIEMKSTKEQREKGVKEMKRLLAALVVCLFLFSACGGGDDEGATEETSTEEQVL